MTRSRGVPKRCRSGPLSLVASRPPIVAASANGGSSASHWPRCAQQLVDVAAAGRRPRRVTVRSPALVLEDAVDAATCRGGRRTARAPRPSRASCRRRESPPTASARSAHCSVAATAARDCGFDDEPAAGSRRWRRHARSGGRVRIACPPACSSAVDGCGFSHGQKRSARPARSAGCARYGPGTSPHSRGVGNTLPGLHRPARIEGAAHALHQRQVVVGEHPRHVLRLVGADAVLAGDRSAGLDAVGQDLGGHRLGPLRLPRDLLVVADQRVQVAVAGVEHVADAQPRALLRAARMRPSTSGSLRARHHAVLHVVVRRHAAHRGERRLAALPDARALLVVCAPPRSSSRRCARQMSSTMPNSSRTSASRAVELDDQHRVGRRESPGAPPLRRPGSPARPSSRPPPG